MPPAHTHCLVNPSVPALRSVSGRHSAAVVDLGVGGLPPLPAAGPLLSSICRSITMKGLYGPFCPGGRAWGGWVSGAQMPRSFGCPSHRKTIRDDDFLFTEGASFR